MYCDFYRCVNKQKKDMLHGLLNNILKYHNLHIKNVFNGHMSNTTAYNVTTYLPHVKCHARVGWGLDSAIHLNNS